MQSQNSDLIDLRSPREAAQLAELPTSDKMSKREPESQPPEPNVVQTTPDEDAPVITDTNNATEHQQPTLSPDIPQEDLDTALALAVHEAELAALHDAQQWQQQYQHHPPPLMHANDTNFVLHDAPPWQQQYQQHPAPPVHDNITTFSLSGATYGYLIPHINYFTTPEPHPDAGRQRLELRLHNYALTERHISGDGNCQFSSLADQLYDAPTLHAVVREKVVWQLKEHPDRYREYVPSDFRRYCKQMSRSGTWGDHVTLQAAADFFKVKICLLTSFEETTVIEVLPAEQLACGSRTLWLSFWAEVHYNSIHPAGEPLPPTMYQNGGDAEKKKLLGSVRLHRLLFG